ncbi:unnamed protein product [Caenorhabditis sp. 36 PRJEB53466]|nr:unnamed protein product [Caenorhabditis sp. 36 PRJEB53466]
MRPRNRCRRCFRPNRFIEAYRAYLGKQQPIEVLEQKLNACDRSIVENDPTEQPANLEHSEDFKMAVWAITDTQCQFFLERSSHRLSGALNALRDLLEAFPEYRDYQNYQLCFQFHTGQIYQLVRWLTLRSAVPPVPKDLKLSDRLFHQSLKKGEHVIWWADAARDFHIPELLDYLREKVVNRWEYKGRGWSPYKDTVEKLSRRSLEDGYEDQKMVLGTGPFWTDYSIFKWHDRMKVLGLDLYGDPLEWNRQILLPPLVRAHYVTPPPTPSTDSSTSPPPPYKAE